MCIRDRLYPQAAEDARYIEDNIPPFHTYEFNIAYTVPLNYGCITSLYLSLIHIFMSLTPPLAMLSHRTCCTRLQRKQFP